MNGQSREFLLYYCRVMLREARARRHQKSFVPFLLNAAGNARRQAMKATKQTDLFGMAA